jgi:hypothetical protein
MFHKYKENIEFEIECDRQLFDSLKTDLKREITVYDYHDLYIYCLDWIQTEFNLELMTLEWDRDAMINLNPTCSPERELFSIFHEFKKQLDDIFDFYASKIEVKPDMKIKVFPDNTTDKEKNMLNYLSGNYYIQPDMENNKFPIRKNRTAKDLVRQAYKFNPDIEHKILANFINIFIDTKIEFCHIQNYCRELKKDIPIKKRINSY